jgi:hypothetical protein
MMKNIYIQLTPMQRCFLKEVFADLDTELLKGNSAAIIAQVYPDGMRVAVLRGKKFEVVRDALGGDKEKKAATLAEHITDKFKE